MLRDMDAEKIEYPKEYVQNLGKAGLLGLRFDPSYGGRGMSWAAEIAVLEEIGVLGHRPGLRLLHAQHRRRGPQSLRHR